MDALKTAKVYHVTKQQGYDTSTGWTSTDSPEDVGWFTDKDYANEVTLPNLYDSMYWYSQTTLDALFYDDGTFRIITGQPLTLTPTDPEIEKKVAKKKEERRQKRQKERENRNLRKSAIEKLTKNEIKALKEHFKSLCK